MTEYNEEKIYNNIEALTRQLYSVFEDYKNSNKLTPSETRQYELYIDYNFWLDFAGCADETEASCFFNKNGINITPVQCKKLAEFIGVLVYILTEAETASICSFYNPGEGLWDFALWDCNSNIPAVTLQAIVLNFAIWEYDNYYLQGGTSWLINNWNNQLDISMAIAIKNKIVIAIAFPEK